MLTAAIRSTAIAAALALCATPAAFAGEGYHSSAQGHEYGAQGKQARSATQARMQKSSRTGERQVSGTVERMKRVRVRDAQPNLVVLLRTDQGSPVLVDLGPHQDLEAIAVVKGSQIAVRGFPARVSDRPVLFAGTVTADGQEIAVQRPQRIKSMQQARLQGRQGASEQASLAALDLNVSLIHDLCVYSWERCSRSSPGPAPCAGLRSRSSGKR